MSAEQQSQRLRAATAGFDEPLANDGIVQHIISIVGAQCYAFLALNKQWKAAHERAGLAAETQPKLAFKNEACLRFAHSAGLDMNLVAVQRLAGRAKIPMLKLAHELGMPYTSKVSLASLADKEKLEYLYLGEGCPLHVNAAKNSAIKYNCWGAVELLLELGETFTDDHFRYLQIPYIYTAEANAITTEHKSFQCAVVLPCLYNTWSLYLRVTVIPANTANDHLCLLFVCVQSTARQHWQAAPVSWMYYLRADRSPLSKPCKLLALAKQLTLCSGFLRKA
jgi:hypothetical protein